jgi:hypothetical protein
MFKYRPLDTTRAQIRLLLVTRNDDRIHCEIHTTELKDPALRLRYHALSYTWGPSTPTASIFIDGHPYFVPQNLFAFLEKFTYLQANSVALRHSDNRHTREGMPWLPHTGYHSSAETSWIEDFGPRYIWIDQLCVDQSNTDERNHQVQLMSNIYRFASIVTVWLGTAPESSHGEGCPEEEVVSILRNPYFDRLWIVQELLLGRSIEVLMYTKMSYDWSTLSDTVLSGAAELQAMGIPQRVVSLFHQRQKGEDLTFGSCISSFCGNGCVDLRDKVYGFMGFVRESQGIVIDYDKPVYTIYLDVAMAFRHAYLNRRHLPRPALKEYPFKSEDYYNILVELSKHMITSYKWKAAADAMMNEIWAPFVPEQYNSNGRPDHPPVTGIGWSNGEIRATAKTRSLHQLPASGDYWWYECDGQRNYYYVSRS